MMIPPYVFRSASPVTIMLWAGLLLITLFTGGIVALAGSGERIVPASERGDEAAVSVIKAWQGPQLVMFDQAGCSYCELWEEQIGTVYDSTDEGRFAPLRRVRIWKARQLGLYDIIYTPTFVVFDKGREIGRITGYPGEQMFWPMLDDILAKAGYGQQPKPAPEKAA